jgi:hypothetical protein
MKEVLGFLIIVIVSALDPIRLVGYILAGSLIRKRAIAVAVGVLWMLVLQVLLVLAVKKTQSTIPAIQIAGTITGSVLVTFLVHWIGSRIRAKNQKTTSTNQEKN